MGKRDLEAWEIVMETVTAVAVLVYIGLQIYYHYAYKGTMVTILYHLLPVILLYAGMTVLQAFPELLNGSRSEPLKGMVRTYAVRMVRNSKLLLILGMLLPSAADALGVGMDPVYSLLLMGGVLGTIAYYLYQIYRYNKNQEGK